METSKRKFKPLIAVVGVVVIIVVAIVAVSLFTTSDKDFDIVESTEGVTITGYTGRSENVKIPAEINDKPVIAIGSSAFLNKDLKKVTIPSSVKTIGNNAFQNNELETVTMPSSLTTIGSYAFYENELLTLVIPSGVTSIGTYAFSENELTTTINIPSSVTKIGANAFGSGMDDDQIVSLTIDKPENSITGSPWGARGTVTWDDSLPPIDGFFYSETAGEITITDYIGGSTTVNVPAQLDGKLVMAIGDNAFSDNNLKTVVIPDSVKSIGNYAFNDNDLVSVIIPSSVTSIGNYAFCENDLVSVTISSGVKTIGSYAFDDNDLTAVTIPSSVTTIGTFAFDDNELILTLTIQKPKDSISGSPWGVNPSNVTWTG